MNVLSLCDGIACGLVALDRLGIPVEHYFASEIKDAAIRVSGGKWHGKLCHIGDVNNVYYDGEWLYYISCFGDEVQFPINFDLVMFGSPCQTFSVAMKADKRIGFDDKEKSGVFWQCLRVLREIQVVNPDVMFLVENVASMPDSDRDVISHELGVKPYLFDSAEVSPCMRQRYYWTNLDVSPLPHCPKSLQSILDSGYTDREVGRAIRARECAPHSTPIKIFYRYYARRFGNIIFKSKEHFDACVEHFNHNYLEMAAKDIDLSTVPSIYNGVRYLNQHELERCMGLPKDYTDCLDRNSAANVIGDGWTIPVIEHILSHMDNKWWE